VQEILAENQPMIFLASPDILVGAKNTIGNFHPAVLETVWCSGMSTSFTCEVSRERRPVMDTGRRKQAAAWTDTRLVRECLSGSEQAWSLLIESIKRSSTRSP